MYFCLQCINNWLNFGPVSNDFFFSLSIETEEKNHSNGNILFHKIYLTICYTNISFWTTHIYMYICTHLSWTCYQRQFESIMTLKTRHINLQSILGKKTNKQNNHHQQSPKPDQSIIIYHFWPKLLFCECASFYQVSCSNL